MFKTRRTTRKNKKLRERELDEQKNENITTNSKAYARIRIL